MILPSKERFVEPIMGGTKIHTIREDRHNRWREGMKIHMATCVRTKKYHCFREEVCRGKQKIHMYNHKKGLRVYVDGTPLTEKKMRELIYNDGFIEWFFPRSCYVYAGKIIHWTDKKY
jgi:hypothetical protein